MPGDVLIVGTDNEQVGQALALSLPTDVRVRSAETAGVTEGIGVEVVVVAGAHPMAELTEVRTHPRLYDKPVVLLAPGATLETREWTSVDVWPVTRQDAGLLDELDEHVARLLAKARHPASGPTAMVARAS